MCIYFGNQDNLTYSSQEHVLPAGLGCHTKLPKGAVSDKANQYFSPIERRVLEQSFVQLNRIVEGPGKRGSLSPSKATTSDVSIIELNGACGLGYMKGMQGFILNHFIIDMENDEEEEIYESGIDGISRIRYCQGSENQLPDDEVEYKKLYTSDMLFLKDKLSKWEGYYKYLYIDSRSIFVTYFKDKVYIAAKNEPSGLQIGKLREAFRRNLGYRSSKKDAGNLKLTLEINHGFIDVAKVATKTAINTLCYLKGVDIIYNSKDLDEVKKSIFADDESILSRVIENPNAGELKGKLHLDNDVHACLLCNLGRILKGYVIFYQRCFEVTLSGDSDIDVNIMNGIVCEWKKMKDSSYHEYLLEKGVLFRP